MAALVVGWKLGVIVLVLVEETQRDQSPINRVPCLGRHFGDPAGRDPRKRAYRIPEEFDVIVLHPLPFIRACCIRLGDALAVWAPQTGRRIVPSPPPLEMPEPLYEYRHKQSVATHAGRAARI